MPPGAGLDTQGRAGREPAVINSPAAGAETQSPTGPPARDRPDMGLFGSSKPKGPSQAFLGADGR